MKKSKITRRDFIRATSAVVGVGAIAGCRDKSIFESKSPAKRPNLVFIFSDQQSYDMLGCYGNKQLITPNIDKFASDGIRFNHCVSNMPMCTPYRGILMSGQHPLYNGAFSNDVQVLINNGKFFGEALRDAGYRTGYVGKWHLYGGDRDRPIPAGPHRLGFDDTFLSNNCTLQFNPKHAYYWDENGKQQYYDVWEPYGEAQHANDFLDNCADDKPFALFVSWHPPHDMGVHEGGPRYETIPELMKYYDRDTIKLRPNTEDKPQTRDDYHGYMSMCTGIDIAFGRIMDKLKEKQLQDNTIVIFTADHGDLLNANGRPWAKGFPEDESVRVPLIVRWPEKLAARKTSDLLIGTLDLMPTILGMMGCEIPSTCQGKDLASSIMSGREDTVESVFMFHSHPAWRGVYTQRYTYAIENFSSPEISFNVLYDKQTDPYQKNNLFGNPNYRALQEKLHKMTQKWLDYFKDPFADGYAIMKACDLDLRTVSQPGHEGTVPGRPIDLLKKAK